jgi:putative DNA primase/helicase
MTTLPVNPEAIPNDLKRSTCWVCWAAGKVPINPSTGKPASPTDESTWGTYAQAMKRYQAGLALGIGYVLHEQNGLVVVDLDHCRDPQSGTIEAWAEAILVHLDSYAEVSPSGTGIHIWVRGTKPAGRCRRQQIELYAHARCMTVTGCHLMDTPATIERRQDAINRLYADTFPTPSPKPPVSTNGTQPTHDDATLLALARDAQNGGKFVRLWDGDIQGYNSQSEADLALAVILAFWTRDAEQIDRLFRQSALMRPKWDTRHGEQTYGARTIAEAIQRQTDHYHDRTVSPTIDGQRPLLGGMRTIAASEVLSWRR